MCGIAGIYCRSGRAVDSVVLDRMRDSLAHRGPDGAGSWTDGHIGLAHRRLSIIDLAGGAQPMIHAATGVVITFNGEIYNFLELREELEALGHHFRTHSDTEVLLSAYVEWGSDMIGRLAGMFAFAIWDPRSHQLLLVRDRFGVKPLYWTEAGEQLLFASELKAFQCHPDFRPKSSLDAISSYLTFRQAVWDVCFFDNVNKVPPGHLVIIGRGGIETRCYWSIPIRGVTVPSHAEIGDDAFEAAVMPLLERAVKRRLISDVPVGAYLSGGLDSSIVVAMMSQYSSEPVNSFSIGFAEDGYDEGPFAQRVADHVGARHEHFVLDQGDYTDRWIDLIRHNDIPLSIPHEIALNELSRLMKQKVSVALSGEGADELFGGYGRVQRSPMDWKKVSAARALMGGRLADAVAASPMARGTALAELRHSTHMSHFFSAYNWIPFEEKWSLMSSEAMRSLDGDRRTLSVFEDTFRNVGAADPYDRILHLFQKIHLGGLLDRLDMNSMAWGLEVRVPFIDHQLVEYVVGMPVHLKMRWKSLLHKARAVFHSASRASEWLDDNKYLLRRIGGRLVPPEIAKRKKLGFPTPLDSWMQKGMVDLARDLLLSPNAQTRDIFDRKKIAALLDNPQNLPFDFYGKKIWMLTNVEIWHREVVSGRSSAVLQD